MTVRDLLRAKFSRRKFIKLTAGVLACGTFLPQKSEGGILMSTPHNAAQVGDIADKILLPGDPLRAKYIAENFLIGAKKYNEVRNIFGYTGTYKGVPVSVQGTGMGIPSISIYVHELIHTYGVKKLIRVGTCGGMHESLNLRDVVIAQGASTDSSIVHQTFGGAINFSMLADFDLLSKAVDCAKKLNLPVKVGNILSTDIFYNDYSSAEGTFTANGLTLDKKMIQHGILAVEMETAALYLLASAAQVQALGIFTVSDHIVKNQHSTPKERENSFNEMIKIALETIIG